MEFLLQFYQGFVDFLPKIPLLLVDVLLGYVVITILVWLFERFLRLTRLPKLKGVAVSFTKTALWILFVIIIANQLGFSRLAVAISGSVLVLAFVLNTGLAPLVTDVISGLFLCGDPDFRTGSKIKFGAGDNLTIGTIMEVDMRKVRVRDEAGNVVVLPNSLVDKDKWVVLEKSQSRAASRAAVVKEKAKQAISARMKK